MMEKDLKKYYGMKTVTQFAGPSKDELRIRLEPVLAEGLDQLEKGEICPNLLISRLIDAAYVERTVTASIPCSFSVQNEESIDHSSVERKGHIYLNGVIQDSDFQIDPDRGLKNENHEWIDFTILNIDGDQHIFTKEPVTLEDIEYDDHYCLSTDAEWMSYIQESKELVERNFFLEYVRLAEWKAETEHQFQQGLIHLIRANKRVLKKTGYWNGLEELAGFF